MKTGKTLYATIRICMGDRNPSRTNVQMTLLEGHAGRTVRTPARTLKTEDETECPSERAIGDREDLWVPDVVGIDGALVWVIVNFTEQNNIKLNVS